MTSLLVVKEKIMGFYKNFEVLVKIIAKFILAYFAFSFVNTELGYLEALTGITPTLFLSAVCAIVPVSVFVLLFALVVVLHLYKLSAVLSVIALVVFLLFYLIYLKFAPNQGILIILYPVLAQFNLHFMLPLIGAMAFNPFAAIPVAFGVIFVKVLEYLKDAASLGNTGADVQGIMTSYQYIFDNLLQDKEMIAYIVVFTVVIVAVYAISRLSINYSWYIAIVVGTIINVAGLAVMGADVKGISIGMVLVGSILGGLLAAIAQFMGCTLDYSRKEYLQFEDDDYYYYVKAVPKIQVTQAERTVKTFGNDKASKKEKAKKEKNKKEKPQKEKKAKKTKNTKTQEEVLGNTESAVEETVMSHFDDKPPVQETRTFETPKKAVSDFDELSFDGFDFDNLD